MTPGERSPTKHSSSCSSSSLCRVTVDRILLVGYARLERTCWTAGPRKPTVEAESRWNMPALESGSGACLPADSLDTYTVVQYGGRLQHLVEVSDASLSRPPPSLLYSTVHKRPEVRGGFSSTGYCTTIRLGLWGGAVPAQGRRVSRRVAGSTCHLPSPLLLPGDGLSLAVALMSGYTS